MRSILIPLPQSCQQLGTKKINPESPQFLPLKDRGDCAKLLEMMC